MPGDEEEAQFIAHEIADLHRVEKIPLEDVAILFRTNMQSRSLEQAMREEQIPYRMIGAQSFYDKREVRDVMAYLEVMHNPLADVPLLRIMNAPPRGIGQGASVLLTDSSHAKGSSVWEAMGNPPEEIQTRAKKGINEFVELVQQYRERIITKHENMGRVMLEFLNEIGYIEWVKRNSKNEKESDQRRDSIDDVIQMLTHASKHGKSLQEFLRTSALAQDREDDNDIEKQKGVTLITLHASKGMEYPIVYLVGLEQGILPHKRSVEEGTSDEERRLLYVGITRAQDRLTLTRCDKRSKYGREEACEESVFLKELSPEYLEMLDYDDIMGAAATEDDIADLFSIFD